MAEPSPSTVMLHVVLNDGYPNKGVAMETVHTYQSLPWREPNITTVWNDPQRAEHIVYVPLMPEFNVTYPNGTQLFCISTSTQ